MGYEDIYRPKTKDFKFFDYTKKQNQTKRAKDRVMEELDYIVKTQRVKNGKD